MAGDVQAEAERTLAAGVAEGFGASGTSGSGNRWASMSFPALKAGIWRFCPAVFQR